MSFFVFENVEFLSLCLRDCGYCTLCYFGCKNFPRFCWSRNETFLRKGENINEWTDLIF